MKHDEDRIILTASQIHELALQNKIDILMAQLAEAQEQNAAMLAVIEHRKSMVDPFEKWAQLYLVGGRWAGFSYYEAIKAELLERDKQLADRVIKNLKLRKALFTIRRCPMQHFELYSCSCAKIIDTVL